MERDHWPLFEAHWFSTQSSVWIRDLIILFHFKTFKFMLPFYSRYNVCLSDEIETGTKALSLYH